MSAAGITIASASAGSGKTYRLTREVTSALDHMPVDALFAVTFTKKAEAELAARIRRKLVEAGRFDDARRLPLAYLGTVHGTCLRLLKELAIDAGLSPSVDVIAEAEEKLLRQALDGAIDHATRERVYVLARRLKIRWDDRESKTDWLIDVANVMELARSNRIDAAALPAMAEMSAAGLLRLLPAPERNGAPIDAALRDELPRARDALVPFAGKTKKTRDAIELIDTSMRELGDGELPWSSWSKLATIAPAKPCAALVSDLRLAAARHVSHPRLHDDIREMTRAVFEAARAGLGAYAEWKQRRRVVDYVDMLDRALDLLSAPRVVSELQARLAFAVVDEFQDTSPIQLALFMRVHALAGRSIWVGDRKQCIFEYAGADPMLMDRVAAWTEQKGGRREHLGDNYRSRPELVEACSELFASALARHGFRREEVVVSAKRTTPPELAELPPLGVLFLETTTAAQDAEAIAEGVRRILDSPTPIVDRRDHRVRAARPGDVAVLVMTNAEALAVAAALHARGLRSALARAGLLATPEGQLVQSALRWLIDPGDSLAAATIDALLGVDDWLATRLAGERPSDGWRARLEALRSATAFLAPTEAVDAVLGALDAVEVAARWPDPHHRIANLDALRALAAKYEERCAQEREAGTVAGLLRYFGLMQVETLRKDEMIASDDQHLSADEGAIVVSTYHKAKGLEWPVVVLGSLHRPERRSACEVCPESDGDDFDPDAPLRGRWIRYWAYPFGKTTSELKEAIEGSNEGARVANREDQERARLLYVGFTRARDHLVLAVRAKSGGSSTVWLDSLSDGAPLVTLPTDGADGATATANFGPVEVPTRVMHVSAERTPQAPRPALHRWFSRGDKIERARHRIAPSNAANEWPALALPSIGRIEPWHSPIPVLRRVTEWDRLGDAVHAFLAADRFGLSSASRARLAESLVPDLAPDSMIEMGDRLRSFVESRWPGAIWLAEWPIEATIGDRRIGGTIDLLLETADAFVLIDHKSFPGRGESAWRKKAHEHLPQLAAYREALLRLGTKPVTEMWLHFPIGGAMVQVVC